MIWQFIFSILLSLTHLRFVQFNDYGKIAVKVIASFNVTSQTFLQKNRAIKSKIQLTFKSMGRKFQSQQQQALNNLIFGIPDQNYKT